MTAGGGLVQAEETIFSVRMDENIYTSSRHESKREKDYFCCVTSGRLQLVGA